MGATLDTSEWNEPPYSPFLVKFGVQHDKETMNKILAYICNTRVAEISVDELERLGGGIEKLVVNGKTII